MNNETWKHGIFTYKVEHGTKWLLVFQHSTKNGFFTQEKASFNLQKGKFSILKWISNFHYIKRYNSSFEFLLEYPEDFPNKSNRWLQSVNPLDETDYNTTTSGSLFYAEGFSKYWLDFSNRFGGLLRSHSGLCLLDGELGYWNWWYAIGDWRGQYVDKTPGPHDITVTSVYLWIRISSPYYNTCKQQRNLVNTANYFLFLFIIYPQK